MFADAVKDQVEVQQQFSVTPNADNCTNSTFAGNDLNRKGRKMTTYEMAVTKDSNGNRMKIRIYGGGFETKRQEEDLEEEQVEHQIETLFENYDRSKVKQNKVASFEKESGGQISEESETRESSKKKINKTDTTTALTSKDPLIQSNVTKKATLSKDQIDQIIKAIEDRKSERLKSTTPDLSNVTTEGISDDVSYRLKKEKMSQWGLLNTSQKDSHVSVSPAEEGRTTLSDFTLGKGLV